ncbi:MAG TPA: GspH/FimT family pseudopilin [Steroidobacteraceae bacterium]|nr:GspH/FimT family pseudopilin [Steroidobacteraceae bacterium]
MHCGTKAVRRQTVESREPASTRARGVRTPGGPHRQPGIGAAAKEPGFTLIELMITLAVAMILLVIAFPALQNFLRNDRQWTTANSLVMSLNAARSEAIKQDTAVSLCPTTNGTSCSTTAPWAQGWIVLSGAAGAAPVFTVPPLATGTTLTEANGLQTVTFLSTGMVAAPAAFTLCDSRGAAAARYVQVSLTGSIASSSTVGQTVTGAALTCP